MTQHDLEITLDGEAAAAVNRPSVPAWPAEAVRGALLAPDAAPGFAADDADVAEDRQDAPPRQGPGDPEPAIETDAGQADRVPITLEDHAPPPAPGPGADTALTGGQAEGISVPSPDDRGRIIIHAVNYYARPATSLSELPNEWAGNRARP